MQDFVRVTATLTARVVVNLDSAAASRRRLILWLRCLSRRDRGATGTAEFCTRHETGPASRTVHKLFPPALSTIICTASSGVLTKLRRDTSFSLTTRFSLNDSMTFSQKSPSSTRG